MVRKKSSRVPPIQMAKEYLLVYPSANNQQVVDALSISEKTVSNARRFLIQTGQLEKSFYSRRGSTLGTTPLADISVIKTESAASLGTEAEVILASADMDVPERRRRLSELARKARVDGSGQLEIAAIQAIAKLDEQSGTKDSLGPGPPLSRADKVNRLGVLIEVCGASITAESVVKSLERPELDTLIDEIGRFMAKKGTNESRSKENPSPTAA